MNPRTPVRLASLAVLSAALLVSGAQLPAVAATSLPSRLVTAPSTPPDANLDSDGDGVSDRPDTLSAALAASSREERVEDLSRRTPTTQMFANPDGTWTTESFAAPVRAADPQTGEWAPIDTELAKNGGLWQPKSAVGGMRFSNGGDAPLVAFTDVNGKDLSWSWPTALPTPTVDGSTLTYPDVVPDGDLVVEALPDGFSHSVVLRAAPDDELEIPIELDIAGAKLNESGDGTLTITGGKGEMLSAPAPTMWDTGIGPSGKPTVVPLTTEVGRHGDQTVMTLKPDSEFLNDPDTVYPVTIDPTFTASAMATATITTPMPASPMWDWRALAGRDSSGPTTYETVLLFDQSTFPAGAVTSASLSMYAETSNSCDPVSLKVRRLTEEWAVLEWANPVTTTAGESVAVQSAKGGPTGCGTAGWDNWDITDIAQAWAGGAENFGLSVAATDATVSGWREYDDWFATNPPKITITASSAPAAPSVPIPSDAQTWDGTYHTRVAKPSWSTSATDPDLGTVRYKTEIHETNTAGSPVVASCTTGYVQSGTTSTCTPTTVLSNGTTYYARSVADDGSDTGPWSPWQQFTVNYQQPASVAVACPTTADATWYSTAPASSMNCTFTSTYAAELEWTLNGVTQTRLPANGSGAATKTGIAIPAAGWTELKVRGLSTSGRASAWKTYSFGTGTAVITTPAAGAGTAKTFTYGAASAAGATSAKLQYRVFGTPWMDATALRTSGGASWQGSVVNTTNLSSLPEVIWTPAAELGFSAPMSIETRVVFSYPSGGADRISPSVTVQLNAHDSLMGSPTAAVGPGEVSLGTGEFQTGAMEAAAGSLAIARSHLSNSEPAVGAAGVFGPGWSASIATGGPAAYVVIDQREANGSFVLTTPDGISYVYKSGSPAASALTGPFAPQGDAVALGSRLNLDPATGVLTYTDRDGESTTFEQRSGRWVPTATVGTAAASTTSYYYDSSGLPSWIIAPPPPGATVTCTPTSLPTGCEALHLTYTTVGGQKRLESVDYQGWDPKLDNGDGDVDNDGLPDSDAGVSTTSVAKYAYNTNGTLQAAWDPRLGDGAAALKTTYEYAISGTKTRLTKVTLPGLKPWQINYATDGSVTTVTRQQDSAVGSGNATWTIRYGLSLNSESQGLPNLSAAKTAAWGQQTNNAPETGAGVFGPDRVPAANPSATDWKYAQLYYWNNAGRLTNTANYGASAWQISTSRYDSYGNEIWSLSPAGRERAIADGAGNAANSAAAADRYASQVLYNASGNRVEAQYGPTVQAMNEAGSILQLRSLTQYDYDDEVDLADAPGRDLETIPDGGFGVAVATRSSATDEATAGTWAINQTTPSSSSTHLYDTKEIRYRYDPAAAGDASGWVLRKPTQVKVQNGSGSDTTIYRYDTTGRVVQERTAEGAATGQETRWHDTVYYTADGSASRAECRNNAAWAGQVCWEGPHAQPATGQGIPATTYVGYSAGGSPTRIVTVPSSANATTVTGVAKKTQVNQFDRGGRTIRAATTTAGVADQAVPATTTSYSSSTGLPTSVSNGSMTMVTSYDTWGRVTSQTDGAGNTTTTTYNGAAQLATVNDGKGTYTYAYNETFTDFGLSTSTTEEHRGAPTSVNVGISGVAASVRGSYDANGNLGLQQTPGATATGDFRVYNLAGDLTTRAQVPSGWFMGQQSDNVVDVRGRVRRMTEPSGTVDYQYDNRGRLTQAADQITGQGCSTRKYALTADSNRTSLTTYNPNAAGKCQSTTVATTKTSSYDSADRITNAGYTYDDLGRTTTLGAGDTNTPTNGNVTGTYYANDMVATLAQGAQSQNYTLDPLGRISTTKMLTSGVSLIETTNHYTDTSDNPAWTETRIRPNSYTAWTVSWTRYVKGLDGALAIVQNSSGTSSVPTFNAHGDVIANIDLGGTTWGGFTKYNEFGAPLLGTAVPGRYGWLGTEQRDGQSVGGLVLMGARLYNPATGRFLSRDAVQGGSDNAYVYPPDPVNLSDTTGMFFEYKHKYFTYRLDLVWKSTMFGLVQVPWGLKVSMVMTRAGMAAVARGLSLSGALDAVAGLWNNGWNVSKIVKAALKTLFSLTMKALRGWALALGTTAAVTISLGRCATWTATVTLANAVGRLPQGQIGAVRC